MDWTSLYFQTNNLNVFILGTGEVASRRANRFLDKGSNVILAGDNLSKDLLDKGAILKSTDDVDELVKWADFVIIASGDRNLSEYVSKLAKDKLLNRADIPEEGNIIVPTTFNIGSCEVSIFTGGKSPLMAKQLRKKIQSIITEEDILEIELQEYSRNILKEKIANQKDRRKILYDIFNNEYLNTLIKDHKVDEAKEYIQEFIRSQ